MDGRDGNRAEAFPYELLEGIRLPRIEDIYRSSEGPP
jgi:hypothetical protein